MKKFIKYLFLFILFFTSATLVEAKDATMYFFYGEGCPHCAKEKEFLNEMEVKYPNLEIKRYEVYNNSENKDLMNTYKQKFNVTGMGVPFTVVGDSYVYGYSEIYNEKIENMIREALGLEKISYEENNNDNKENNENEEVVPILGKINIKNISLVLISIVLGLVDGFNPCAMWVLILLISYLIGISDKKRRWIIGITFLLTSALMYLLIMMSWLNIVVNITSTVVIRSIIAILAVVAGLINLKGYLNQKVAGCTVVKNENRKKTFDKIKKFTTEKSLIICLVGVITLAISVNLVELACSLGLPVLFSSILAVNNVTGFTAFLYTLVYILFFLLDDLIVFLIAMFTLKVIGISNKYSKYSKLIGGIIMLIIGLLLLVKPEWVMFNF
ncbi:MAG: hypothetical protein PUC23_05290 [bacterium]|nr:hypothetical protein [bacterium]